MPNTTKLDRELAAASGGAVTANQVHRWRDEGRLSALPLSRAAQVEHLLALAPLMGKGRDGDVAVLKLAAAGRPCECLRRVLAELQEVPPSQRGLANDVDRITIEAGDGGLLGPLRDVFGAQDAPANWKLVDGLTAGSDGPISGEDVRASFALPLAQAVAGEDIEPGDVSDLGAIVDNTIARHLGDNPRGLVESMNDPTNDAWDKAYLRTIRAIVEASRSVHPWIETASPIELARGVCIGAELVNAMSEAFWTMGDEERWRIAGRIAPMAAAILPLLATVGKPLSKLASELASGSAQLPMTASEGAVLMPMLSAMENLVELAGALGLDAEAEPTTGSEIR